MRRLLLVLLVSCTPSSNAPAVAENSQIPTVGLARVPQYDRSSWGRWKDADKDCQDTRQEVLIAESLDPVVMDERGCKVLSGRWKCRYTGNEYLFPGALDIDHVVAIAEAHDHGGHAWDRDKKRAYFNDLGNPDHLIAVDKSANRSKGSRGPDDWLPPNEAYRCEYLKIRATILDSWDLTWDCRAYFSLLASFCH